jgi:hypothetical protein
VVLIHFPIALFLTSVMFDFIAQWTKNRTMAAVAYYNLLAAAISCASVMVTGLLAWHWQMEGQRLKGILLQAPDPSSRIMHIDLAGLVAAVSSLPRTRTRLSALPSPDGDCGVRSGRLDWASREILS